MNRPVSQRRRSPFPLVLALLLAVLMLLLTVLVRRGELELPKSLSQLFRGGTVAAAPAPSAQVRRAAPEEPTPAMKPRGSPRLGRRSADAPFDSAGTFPESESIETSTSLELAGALGRGGIVGWVSDRTGRGVDDASVAAYFAGEGAAKDEDAAYAATKADASGRFGLADLPVGGWFLRAEAGGFAKCVAGPFGVEPDRETAPVELRLESALTLRGVVKSETGKPLPSVTIAVRRAMTSFDAGGNQSRTLVPLADGVLTGEDGSFAVEALPAGNLRVSATIDGYARHRAYIEFDHATPPLEIVLQAEAPFAGFVRDDRGNVVPGASVRVTEANAPHESLAEATTRADGQFRIRGLPARTSVRVFAEAKGYGSAGPLILETGSERHTIVLTRGGAIEGRAIQVADGKPAAELAIAAVSATPGLPMFLRTRTREDGSYRMMPVTPGVWHVFVASDRLQAAPKLNVSVPDGETQGGIDFAVYEGLSVRAFAVDKVTGAPIGNATIRAQPLGLLLSTGKPPGLALTQATGYAELSNLPEGLIRFSAEAKGYLSTRDSRDDVTQVLVRNRPSSTVELRLTPGGRVDGTVVDALGNPAENATVEAFDALAPTTAYAKHRTTTATDGSFAMEGLPISRGLNLRLVATASDGTRGDTDLFLDPRTPTGDVVISLDAGAALEVRVEAGERAPIAGAAITVRAERFPAAIEHAAWKAETQADGTAWFPRLVRGRVIVRAEREGFVPAEATIELPLPEPPELTLRMIPAAVLNGEVVDDFGDPIEAGHVVASAPNGITETVAIGRSGTFQLKAIPGGAVSLDIQVERMTNAGTHRRTLRAAGTVGTTAVQRFAVPFNASIVGGARGSDGALLPSFRARVEGSYQTGDGGRRAEFASEAAFTGGEYRFDSMPPGEYRVTVSAEGHLPETGDWFDVASPDERVVSTLHLRGGGGVRITAVDAETSRPVEGALVRALEREPQTRTARSGEAILQPLEPGIVTIVVTHPDYLEARRDTISVPAGRVREEPVLRMERGTLLEGTVVDRNDRPVPNASVELRVPLSTERLLTTTDGAGGFRFRGRQSGESILTVTTRLDAVPVCVSLPVLVGASASEPVIVRLMNASTLRGYLAGPPDADFDRATVNLYPMSVDEVPLTGMQLRAAVRRGGFEVAGLCEGLYLVAAAAPARHGTVRWHDILRVDGPMTVATIDAGIQSIGGTITDRAGGTPLERLPVTLSLLSSPIHGNAALAPWWRFRANTDGDGRFHVRNLSDGSYDLNVAGPSAGENLFDIVTLRGGSAHPWFRGWFLPEPVLTTDNPPAPASRGRPLIVR